MTTKHATEGAWCILRTSGRTTLRLAESLAEDGFEVWTPIETRSVRIPKANVKRTVHLPIMPSYIFARAAHLIDLLQMAALDVKPRRKKPGTDAEGERETVPAHASFSVMHSHDGIPFVADAHLQRLRTLEAKLTPMKKAERTFGTGLDVNVKIEGGSFAGMKGVVRKSDNAYTLVCFDERMTVKIPTCLLEQDQLWGEVSQLGDAVRKAA